MSLSASVRLLSVVSPKPAQMTDTRISFGLWPGELKCRPTGSSGLAVAESKCSRNLSPGPGCSKAD